MAGNMMTIPAPGGAKFKAYVALPPGGKGPGLVMLQEIFGINAAMRDVADRFAEEGYVAGVPDLFWRIKPGIDLGYAEADFAKAFEYYGQFDVDKAIRRAQPKSKSTGVDSSWERKRKADEEKGKLREVVVGLAIAEAMGKSLAGVDVVRFLTTVLVGSAYQDEKVLDRRGVKALDLGAYLKTLK